MSRYLAVEMLLSAFHLGTVKIRKGLQHWPSLGEIEPCEICRVITGPIPAAASRDSFFPRSLLQVFATLNAA